MTTVTVSVFNGRQPQSPTEYQITGNTYRDLIDELKKKTFVSSPDQYMNIAEILKAKNSANGQLYASGRGAIGYYDNQIEHNQLDYVVFTELRYCNVKTTKGTTYNAIYDNKEGTILDIHDYMVSNHSFPPGFILIIQGQTYDWNTPVGPLNLYNNTVHLIYNRTPQQTTQQQNTPVEMTINIPNLGRMKFSIIPNVTKVSDIKQVLQINMKNLKLIAQTGTGYNFQTIADEQPISNALLAQKVKFFFVPDFDILFNNYSSNIDPRL
ncbi:Hypothetical protein HVR_LOCUS1167 [uncultured virus]|nr:Hypothetical protein HVR_LOCUS1167 [uncultured virus]